MTMVSVPCVSLPLLLLQTWQVFLCTSTISPCHAYFPGKIFQRVTTSPAWSWPSHARTYIAFHQEYDRPNQRRKPSLVVASAGGSVYNDFEDFDEGFFNDADDDTAREDDDDDGKSKGTSARARASDADLFESLRRRQAVLEATKNRRLDAWRSAPSRMVALPLPNDWVRRVAMDDYDYGSSSSDDATTASHEQEVAAVGGASGSVYLVDLQSGDVRGELSQLHAATTTVLGDEDTSSSDLVIQDLYGEYDGGGIVAIAKKGALVASSGREGGVHLSRIVSSQSSGGGGGGEEAGALRSLGKMAGVNSFVTSLAFDQSGILWVGSAQDGRGKIQGFDCSGLSTADDNTPKLSNMIAYETRVASSVLSLSLASDIGCGVATTRDGGIVLFSLQDGTALDTWDPFQDETEFARSAIMVQNDDETALSSKPPMNIPDPRDPTQEALLFAVPTWSVVVGGSQGNLHQRRVKITPEGTVPKNEPWDDVSPPQVVSDRFRHSGSIVSLVSPGPKLFLSAGQDGSIRVWDCSYMQQPDDLDEKEEKGEGVLLSVGTTSGPRPLFGMAGYKVWLGSLVLWKKTILVTDGADNCVVAHYFQKAEGEVQ